MGRCRCRSSRLSFSGQGRRQARRTRLSGTGRGVLGAGASGLASRSGSAVSEDGPAGWRCRGLRRAGAAGRRDTRSVGLPRRALRRRCGPSRRARSAEQPDQQPHPPVAGRSRPRGALRRLRRAALRPRLRCCPARCPSGRRVRRNAKRSSPWSMLRAQGLVVSGLAAPGWDSPGLGRWRGAVVPRRRFSARPSRAAACGLDCSRVIGAASWYGSALLQGPERATGRGLDGGVSGHRTLSRMSGRCPAVRVTTGAVRSRTSSRHSRNVERGARSRRSSRSEGSATGAGSPRRRWTWRRSSPSSTSKAMFAAIGIPAPIATVVQSGECSAGLAPTPAAALRSAAHRPFELAEASTASAVPNRAPTAGRASREAANATPAIATARPSSTSGSSAGSENPLARANADCSVNDHTAPNAHTAATAESARPNGSRASSRDHAPAIRDHVPRSRCCPPGDRSAALMSPPSRASAGCRRAGRAGGAGTRRRSARGGTPTLPAATSSAATCAGYAAPCTASALAPQARTTECAAASEARCAGFSGPTGSPPAATVSSSAVGFDARAANRLATRSSPNPQRRAKPTQRRIVGSSTRVVGGRGVEHHEPDRRGARGPSCGSAGSGSARTARTPRPRPCPRSPGRGRSRRAPLLEPGWRGAYPRPPRPGG